MKKYSPINVSVLLKRPVLDIFNAAAGLSFWPAALQGKETGHRYLRTTPEPGRKSNALARRLFCWQRGISDADRLPALLHKLEENNVLCRK